MSSDGGFARIRQQAQDIAAPTGGKPSVECDHSPTVATRKTEKIPIGDLLRRGRQSNFSHGGRRNRVGPKPVLSCSDREKQKLVRGSFWLQAPTRQLRANADDSEFGRCARRPTVSRRLSREPAHGFAVVLVLRHQERDEHVHIKQTDHAGLLVGGKSIDIVDR